MGKRIAVIEKEKCHPHKCGNYLCVRLCPVNRTEQECIVEREGKAFIHEELCTGCGICPKRCPFGAIHIINLPEELDKDPVHRYIDENGFSLYNLPTPVFGKVTGIIGRNGIGKSTAIKVLSGIIKPNFGNFQKESTTEDVINYFKGTETQAYFEKMRDNKINVAYKPQQVELIPKQFSGTVKQLLEKADEKNELNKITELLELKNILNNEIDKISGGELQRVAIAATVLKKANVYIFDEPTSYLDIKQRLKVSKFIQNLADEETAVMVIEHDLIILDYMSDYVHLMYGKENAYGVVSHVKVTKLGINTYLSGYLKDENVRFRDHAIKFERTAHEDMVNDLDLVEWKPIDHTLGNFNIASPAGLIKRHDIIGILGENGIGKTSFVKILAGVIKTDSSLEDMKIAYKPQYIEASDDLVINSLQNYEKYKIILKPLNLEELFDRKLNELSGGQLQRVAIASTLLKEADLFLLDEPSAYLDVEQRIIISKVVRDMMLSKGKAALVVDHDLLFLDYLSKKLLVFQGEPAIKGEVTGPMSMKDGMNNFLTDLQITFRRDEESNRPRANKLDSQMDRKQKSENSYYYD